MNLNDFQKELNFRDLGGYPTEDGRTVKTGLFYRCAGLYHFNDKEIEALKALHIKEVVDLRTAEQMKRKPDPEIEGILNVPHAGLVSTGGEQIDFTPKGFLQSGDAGRRQLSDLGYYYTEMPFDNEAIQLVIQEVEKGNVPLLFHCAKGKDRTGVTSMVLLLLLGVPEEAVLQDYLFSNTFRKEAIKKAFEEYKEEIQEHPVLGDLIMMKEGVSEKIGRAILQEIESRYGSYDAYFLHEFHIDEQKKNEIRDRYLEGNKK